MKQNISRRNWLRNGAMLTAGVGLLPSQWDSLLAKSPKRSKSHFQLSQLAEEAKIINDFPKLKARLLANENPYGPSQKAKDAMIEAMEIGYRYSFFGAGELSDLIAGSFGLTKENILLGAGSTELLTSVAYYLAIAGKKKGKIICADPPYDWLMISAAEHGMEWEGVPVTKDNKHNLDAIASKVTEDTPLVYICNPANPNGTVVDTDQLVSFCKEVSKKTTVLVDEAYIDYVDDPDKQSMASLIKEGHNIMVARTFSKVHGFAGIRMGYLLGQQDLLDEVMKYSSTISKQFSTSSLSGLAIAGAKVSFQDKEFTKYCLDKTKEGKAFVYKVLEDLDYEYVPSSTNFILFPLRMHGEQLQKAMFEKGVGIRKWKFAKQHWCRVSIGKMEELELFAEAFRDVVG
ncbi:MAG: histidinol-phosphate aminotransferase family protein [Flammeovirgaceae bacterium]|nr:histidinol-phosphate aminotransferase family protein [Flammeovirgaceae bacterium]